MIVIVTAMDNEYDIVKKHLKDSYDEKGNQRGFLNDKEVLLVKTGIGKVNSAFALANILYSWSNVESNIRWLCRCCC